MPEVGASMMVEKVDVFGHRLVHSYQKYNGVPLLREIGYVFTTNASVPTYKVTFNYQERMDDGGFDYLSDAKPGFNELLGKIATAGQ